MKTGYCSNCKMIVKLSSGSHWCLFFMLWISCPFWIVLGISIFGIFSIIVIPVITMCITILLLIYFNNRKIWFCSRCKIKGTITKKPIATIQQIEKGIFCPNCGTKINEKYDYCVGCGKKI